MSLIHPAQCQAHDWCLINGNYYYYNRNILFSLLLFLSVIHGICFHSVFLSRFLKVLLFLYILVVQLLCLFKRRNTFKHFLCLDSYDSWGFKIYYSLKILFSTFYYSAFIFISLHFIFYLYIHVWWINLFTYFMIWFL